MPPRPLFPQAVLVGVTLLSVNAALARAQTAAALAGCYRFDRPYFTRADFAATPIIQASTPILRLTTMLAPPPNRGNGPGDVPRRPFLADSPMARQAWTSYWVPGDSGAFEVYWGSPVHPLFQLNVHGDSLTGTVTFPADTMSKLRVQRVSAVRIECPRGD